MDTSSAKPAAPAPTAPSPVRTDRPGTSKIQHTTPAIGGPAAPGAAPPAVSPPHAVPAPRPGAHPAHAPDDLSPVPVVPQVGPAVAGNKIKALERNKRHEDSWSRSPNATGTGAIHVKTFHCKLTEDALAYMDQVVNEWLDAHPQYEVKFVNSTIGTFTGKLKEPALICQVWV
jgi:hypothetical protein